MDQLNFSHGISVGLRTGANCTNALRPIKVLQYKNGEPYGFKTELMWCVFGQVNRTKSNKIFYNHLAVNQADAKEVGRPFFQVKKEVIENEMPDMLEQIYNHEFTESQHAMNKYVTIMFQEDLMFIENFKNRTELVCGHFQIRLPFRNDEVNLPNSSLKAELRFACLERNMQEILNSNKIR